MRGLLGGLLSLFDIVLRRSEQDVVRLERWVD